MSFNFIHFSNMLTRKLCLKNISSNLDNNFFMGFKILCEVGGGDTQFSNHDIFIRNFKFGYELLDDCLAFSLLEFLLF